MKDMRAPTAGEFLALVAPLLFLGGCQDEETPFSTAEEAGVESFNVELEIDPSTSARTEETNTLWHGGAMVTFETDFEFADEDDHDHAVDDHDHAHAIAAAPGDDDHVDDHEDDDHGDGDHHGDDDHADDDHADDDHADDDHDDDHDERHTVLVHDQAFGYDIEVAILEPQHRLHWDDEIGEWVEEEPLAGDDRYLMVRLGSSAGTGSHPHVHGTWSDSGEFVDDIEESEEETVEEDFAGMRQVLHGAPVSLTIDGRPYGGALVADGLELGVVETGHGPNYAENLLLLDGTYDVTVTVGRAPLARLSDATDSWDEEMTFTYTGVTIGTEVGDPGTRPRRRLDAGEESHFVVLDEWDGVGHGHHHRLYLTNHKGDSSQSLADGTNSLVCRISGGAARDLYEGGILTSPAVVSDDVFYFQVVLFDPQGLLEHDGEQFFDLSNTGVSVHIVNESSGKTVELHEDDLVPTYSHRHGFHYGANLELPEGAAPQPADDDGDDDHGGHDHG